MTTKMRAAMPPDTSTRRVQRAQVPQPRLPRNEFFPNARWWSKATGALAAWIAVAVLMSATGPLYAQTSEAAEHAGHGHHADHGSSADAPAAGASASTSSSTVLSEGEVVRWNAATRRITLRHGELRNLDMPPMTMVFRVRETPADSILVPGARVRFLAERDIGGFVVSRIEPVGR